MSSEPWTRPANKPMTQKQLKQQASRYVKFVDWSEEDHCFIGRCPELFVGAVHGTDEANVFAELCETVEEWVELLHQDGTQLPLPLAARKRFSGKFVLRVEPALHRRLAAKAVAAGDSLNGFCVKMLSRP